MNGLHALAWTVLNVVELFPQLDLMPIAPKERAKRHFPSLGQAILFEFLFPYRECITPLFQCHFCGRRDRDPRGITFTKSKRKFCHLKGCVKSNDYNDHQHDCCYREWRMITRNFKAQWNNHKEEESKQLALLKRFFQERFRHNMKIKNPMRPHFSNWTTGRVF